MEVTAKFFEIRADGVFIPALAVGAYAGHDGITAREMWLLNRAGRSGKRTQVLLINLVSGETWWDVQNWTDTAMTFAHVHLIENWLAVKSGDVIDINFLRGERRTVRLSEQFEPPKKPYIIEDKGAFK